MTCDRLLYIGVLTFFVVVSVVLLLWMLERILKPKTGAKVLTPLVFSPQEDITAFELSKLLPLIINKRDAESLHLKIEALPEHIKRHITDKK